MSSLVMESEERLSSSSHSQASISSSATPPASSANITSESGHLFQLVSDPSFRASFPLLSHPAFRLYAPVSGCSDFRGLGILGLQGGLTAHPHLGAFPDWWRVYEAQLHGAAALFPPFRGLPPLFTPPSLSQSHTPKKSIRGSAKGLNGAVKAKSASSGASSTSSSPSPAYTTSEQTSTLKSGLNPQNKTTKSNLNYCKEKQSATNPSNWNRVQKSKMGQVQERTGNKAKENPCMTVAEISSTSDSQSRSSSDSSSDTLSSLGSVDLENEDDDEDLSVCSMDSDTQSVSRKVKDSSHIDQAAGCFSSGPNMCSMDSLKHSQAAPLLFGSPSIREEHRKHTSVIQTTGAAGIAKTFSLPLQPNQDALSKPLSSLSFSPNITSSPKPTSITNARNSPDGSRLHGNESNQDKQAKEHQESTKSLKKNVSSSSPSPQISTSLNPQHCNLFLTSNITKNSSHLNGVVQGAVQDAPLALITKPRLDSSNTPDKTLLATTSPCFNTPINLSTGTRHSYPGPPTSGKAFTHQESHRAREGSQPQRKTFREIESDIPSSRDSDDSGEYEDEEDLSDSLSDSDSNLDTDSDNDEEDNKDEEMNTDAESHTDSMPLKLTKSSTSLADPSTGRSNSSSSLNLQIYESPNILQTLNGSWALTYQSPPSSSCVVPPPAKRRRVTDEQALRRPLEHGWKRETRISNIGGRVQGEVAYYAPCGKKLKQYPDIMKYLARNGINEITRDHFSFSAKIRVGNFYEAQEGPEGLQWCLLKEDEVVSCISAMDSHRGRPKSLELQPTDDAFHSRKRKRPPSVSESEMANATLIKLQQKLVAQEIARQAAQIKMMRKLEKRALAQAAKDAKRQKALLEAEEKRKQKEQLKILKQQEKVRRLEQIRAEKELRAQQILEAKRKRKEESINAKTLEAEKRLKEKELRRQQALILKQQERERRKQHMILVKVTEARKKAEERERLKQEKRDEKRLNKERKLELRRLELAMVKELNKPNEDLCLPDQKALPDLSRIPGLLLPDSCFGDCLMVMQFLRCFGKVLGLDRNIKLPTLHMLQAGLLNLSSSAAQLQNLVIGLLSAAVRDPGFPPGSMAQTTLGQHVSSVEINQENMSEILQIYMAAHGSQTDLSPLVESLKTKGFMAHTPTQKATIMGFLVNELASSRSVIMEIDKSIEHMTNLRREKCVIESSLRKLRSSYVKRTGKRDFSLGGEESQALETPTTGQKRRRKVGGIEEEDDEDDDSNDHGEEDEDEEEDGGKKQRKTETCEEEDDEDQAASVEELVKNIEKLTKHQLLIRHKLFESSYSLQSMMLGQDRYKRRYWALPQCGGVFVESTVSKEGPQGVNQESGRMHSAQLTSVKKEPAEVPDGEPYDGPQTKLENSSLDLQQENGSFNLFLQKPSSFSKLSNLLEVPKTSSSDSQSKNSTAAPFSTNALTVLPNSLSTNLNQNIKYEVSSQLLNPTHTGNQQHPLHNDQLYTTQAEKHSAWFSLLPRSPCDEFSLTTSCTNPSSCRAKASSPAPATSNSMTQSTSTFSSNSQKHHLSCQSLCHCTCQQLFGKGTSGSCTLYPAYTHLHDKMKHTMNPNMSFKDMFTKAADPLPSTSVSTSKIGSPVLLSDKSPVLEMAKRKDLPFPQPVPQAAVIDVCELKQSQVCEETVQSWCVEEHAMDRDIAVLQQVEELERKVISASLHVKSWMPTKPQSEREDLLYYEHKVLSHSESTDIVRHADNPLDIAVARLYELERNIERRYLKSPLSTTIQVPLDNRGTVSILAPATPANTKCDSDVEDLVPGLKLWRKALSKVRSGAQLSVCLQHLHNSIAWEKSILKVFCQLCQTGDNEELLLLCDGCDKGCHTYCHNPKITAIPEGDWFCPACIAKTSEPPQRSRKQVSRNSGGGEKLSETKRSRKACVSGEGSENSTVSTSVSSTAKKGGKESRKRKPEDNLYNTTTTKQERDRSKTTTDNSKDLELCRLLLAELQTHQDAWPFMTPVNPKSVPGYRKVIKKPMDFSTIQDKLSNSQYLNLETFIIDVNLVFENCEKFNKDDSDIGRAGHSMRRFFQRRWTELLKQVN
ncbi:Bromodomain adjacent to zinc finger domain protein 2B [Bagarius yarrelli]|uniref:Bromodomain adjacent to zinc finger domain protein 2B n=1 Tax=Bagarius yarrelli TaxID=175774 RepID=A0A556U4L5_BAGYA|nr:Bromodomain adjacent to zinc finger domain protein 2B [Bagarius yarrelli]